MKYLLYILVLFLSLSSITFWEDEDFSDPWAAATQSDNQAEENNNQSNQESNELAPIEVRVTENIPWADCTCYKTWALSWVCVEYKCKVKPWLTSLQSIISNILKYFTAIASLAWVLFIVINWMLLSMWWMDSWAKDEAKKRIIKSLVWLILLLLSWLLLTLIAPWIYK